MPVQLATEPFRLPVVLSETVDIVGTRAVRSAVEARIRLPTLHPAPPPLRRRSVIAYLLADVACTADVACLPRTSSASTSIRR